MNLRKAKQEVKETYENLLPTIKETAEKYTNNIDKIIKSINIETMSNKDIHNTMMSLSVETYYLSTRSDLASLKKDISIVLSKNKQAEVYLNTEGTQGAKNQTAYIDSTDKELVRLIYSNIAQILKNKIDESHRIINTLSSILISRNAEAKLNSPNNIE